MTKGPVAEFMENTKIRDARSIKGKNILIVKTNKLYRNITGMAFPGCLPGFIMFNCDGIRIKTNAEIIITETA
jgi:hypothetical protein